MSKIALTPNDSGTGTFTLAAPNSNTSRTLTLPDSTGELLTTTGDGSGLTGIVIPPIFNPVAVSGTTPSLDVGSYNFFDSGTLTANTTVSFASVPTNANWRYSFKTAIVGGQWDISEVSYLQNFSIAAQEINPEGLFFKPDGTKMYIIGLSGQDVNEYSLSTAWDISTASFLQLFSVGGQDVDPRSISFKPDGTKMYMIGSQYDRVNEYNLSTAWDVSTAVYLQNVSVGSQEANPYGFFFKPDGTKMYVTGSFGKKVYEYNLSTAWNVTTASYSQSFSVQLQGNSPSGVFFKSDGTKMYVTHYDVNEYNLSTAWDISTASHFQTLPVSGQDTGTKDIFFKPDGTKMYLAGSTGDSIYEYDVGIASSVTLPASVENSLTQKLTLYSRVTYEFFTTDGGTTVTLIGEEIV